jgi:hypothetical protein
VLKVVAANGRPQSIGTANTFFLTENASANRVTATFWIEKVKKAHTSGHFFQLQYTQTVMLDFNGLRWPHVSVATLRKKTDATPASNVELVAEPAVGGGGGKVEETELT